MKKIFFITGSAVVFITAFTLVLFIAGLNYYEAEGEHVMPGLSAPVQVHRDEKGMAYIQAADADDAFRAQGFVAAQDRLFSMEMTRRLASGRLAEVLGEDALNTDKRMRTLGFARNARIHARLLDDRSRAYFQAYADGVNDYIQHREDEHPLELKLAGMTPEPWTIEDSLAITYLMGWNSAANANQEIIAQGLIDKVGLDKAREIFPININPDELDPTSEGAVAPAGPADADAATTQSETQDAPSLELETSPVDAAALEELQASLFNDPLVRAILGESRQLRLGSNNWAVAGSMSPNARPVVANDPHLDATMLPGPLYPMGLFCPDFRVVGAGVAGIPGMIIGRSEHVAIGATNAYGDAQDLYIESIDPENPQHYLEGDTSVPFDIMNDMIRVRDRAAEGGYREVPFQIRLTHRGPIVSGVIPGLTTDKAVSVRWSAFETMQPSVGLDALLFAKDAHELRDMLSNVTAIALNLVFADTKGNIGWQTTGRLPIRSRGDGLIPVVVNSPQDNWSGWIPYEEMPHVLNPQRGWVGTANHMTVKEDYPYYYTSYVSPHFRFARMKQVLNQPGVKTVEDHWALQRDIKNLMAERLAPIMAEALMQDEQTRELGERLAAWDYYDRADAVEPTLFQAIYQRFALMTYQDELGEELARQMLGSYYFWQERLREMVEQGDSPWFDNIETPETETRDALLVEAAKQVSRELSGRFSTRVDDWNWGRLHKMKYYNPIRREGLGAGLFGTQAHVMDGSGETLYRALFDFNNPYNVISSASLRMVADLGDPHKVAAVMPSGISGRTFDDHFTDQIDAYMSGETRYWWFSDEAIEEHAEATLTLTPPPFS